MVMNIPKLLELEIMKNAQVLAEGENHRDIVKGIAAVDNFADIGDKKEMVALVVNADISYPENCIKRLKDAGAYGVIAKNPGEGFINACKNASLSLIALPEDVSELKIMQDVSQCIIEKYIMRENYIRTCYNNFYTDEYSSDASEIIVQLSEMLGKAVIAYYAGGRIGSAGGVQISEDDRIEEGEENGRQFVAVGGRKIYGVLIPFRVLNKIYGRLFIETDHELTEPEHYLIKGAMTAVTLATTREFAVTEIEQKMKNELLNDLISGDISSESGMVIRAEDLGWDITKPSVAVICRMSMEGNKKKNDMISAHRRVKTALSHLMDESLGRNDNRIIGAAGDTVNVLWPLDTEKSYAANCEVIREVLTKLFESIGTDGEFKGFTGGIGSEVFDIFGIKKSFDDAANAIKYGYMTGSGNHIYDISGLGIYRFIGKIGSRDELVSFIPYSLKKLIEYDSVSKKVLVDTLDVYLACDCNINKASQQLDIHYKTLVYRINRIKEIMELENIEGDVRLEIQLALKILRMLERTEK